MNTKSFKLTILVLLGSILLVGCNSGTVTNTPAPTISENTPTLTISENTSTPTTSEITPMPTVLGGVANLYVIVSTGSQPTLKYQSIVYVFSNNQLVKMGKTDKGIYVTQIDSGLYDIAIVYEGPPLLGKMQRGVSVDAEKQQNLITFALPPEGTLKTSVLMRSGKATTQGTYVTIVSGDQKVFENSASSSPFVLRSGYTYSVTVKYGRDNNKPVMTFTDEVKIDAEETIEKVFTLPYDETKLKIKVLSGTETVSSFGVVITDVDSGNTIYSSSSYYSDTVVESGKNYKVQVTLKNSTQEKTIKASGDGVELIFNYP
jgi:hypothetical protein